MEVKLELLSSIKQLSRFMGIISEVTKASCGKKPLTTDSKSPADCPKGKATTTGDSSKGKAVLWCSEVEQLNKRLKILEEETKTMKEALFESMEERNNLLKDIYQQFQQLQGCLFSSNLVIENFCDGNSIVSTTKDVRAGTSSLEISLPQPNPTLVTRDLRANLLTFEEPAEELHSLSDK